MLREKDYKSTINILWNVLPDRYFPASSTSKEKEKEEKTSQW